MAHYIILHNHRFGTTAYVVKASKLPTEKEVVKALGIDFEPDREEYIEIQLSEITVLINNKKQKA